MSEEEAQKTDHHLRGVNGAQMLAVAAGQGEEAIAFMFLLNSVVVVGLPNLLQLLPTQSGEDELEQIRVSFAAAMYRQLSLNGLLE